MGLFSFLRNAGAKLFSKDADKKAQTDPAALEAARLRQQEALKKAVYENGIGVKNLDVHLEGDKVTVKGEVANQADREKMVLILGNVEGIATVDDKTTVVKAERESQFYEVKKGDSLSKIAKQYYGDPMKYPAIFEANKPMLKDPDLIYPGQMLRIPPLN
jgi:nucleoid-associated protein YgaU